MAELKEKQKVYALVVILGILGILVYYNFIFKPLLFKFIAKNKEYSKLRVKVKADLKLLANEPAIRNEYASFKDKAEYLKRMLPAQDQISSLLSDFSSLAESSGVKILKIKPEENIADPKKKAVNNVYSEAPISVEARSGYHQLGDFINKLETGDRFIKIVDIDIKGNDQDPRHHNIKFKVITYVLK
jgi:Tfp pilus assembly protein PilO